MTPAQAIGMLDRRLKKHGEDIGLRHIVSGAVGSTETVRAFVRGYKPQDVVGDIQQGDGYVILSPTGLGSPPKQNDKVVIGGARVRNVQSAPEEVRLNGVVVRYNMQIRG
jgi:hypothetical protein